METGSIRHPRRRRNPLTSGALTPSQGARTWQRKTIAEDKMLRLVSSRIMMADLGETADSLRPLIVSPIKAARRAAEFDEETSRRLLENAITRIAYLRSLLDGDSEKMS
jgi:hypothetical protein